MKLRIIVDKIRGRHNRPYFLSIIFFVTLIVLFSYFSPVQADIIFPARIELKEKTAGEFDVLFTLPIINNKKLKAELQLPTVCREVTERKISTSYTSYIETWKVACSLLFSNRIFTGRCSSFSFFKRVFSGPEMNVST